MQSREGSSKKDQGQKVLKFLSEHESQSSQLRSNKLRNATSAKIMRKLKQLWNRQRYLTDDECQSSIDPAGSGHLSDSSLNFEVEQPISNPSSKKQPRKQSLFKRQSAEIKPMHRRQVSSEEERLSLPQKMKRRRDERERKDNQNQRYSINGELSEIEAFNSAIEDFSSS